MPRVTYPARTLSPRTSDMADGEEQQGECWGGSTGASGFDLGNKSFGIADVRSTSIVIVQSKIFRSISHCVYEKLGRGGKESVAAVKWRAERIGSDRVV
ncbi:unnamed protein product [Citrullus colocynthis]|uniref:Uncharacterized protein n=1 Tax=Citrullus colocynthis TaxID=252529 RepID=A0ABP0Z723_9ROSI